MTEISAALRELSEPWEMGDKIKSAIDRAARRAGLNFWRASDLWYGKAHRAEQFEIDAVATALEKKRKEAARNELHELRARLARFESLLAQSDPDFFRPEITYARKQIRALDGNSGS